MTRTPDDRPADAEIEQRGDEQSLADAGLPEEGEAAVPARGRTRLSGLGHRLYNGEAGLNIVGNSRLIYKATAVLILICLLSIVFKQFQFGIEFEGGSSFRLPGTEQQLDDVSQAAEEAGADVATAQVVGGNTLLLRTGALDQETESSVIDA